MRLSIRTFNNPPPPHIPGVWQFSSKFVNFPGVGHLTGNGKGLSKGRGFERYCVMGGAGIELLEVSGLHLFSCPADYTWFPIHGWVQGKNGKMGYRAKWKIGERSDRSAVWRRERKGACGHSLNAAVLLYFCLRPIHYLGACSQAKQFVRMLAASKKFSRCYIL